MADNLHDRHTPRTAFIAGATGYTGSALVKRLRRQGVAVVAHVRPDSPQLEMWRRRFAAAGAITDTTPWDEAAMKDTLARVRPDVVFALLGTTQARMRRAQARGGGDSYATVDYGLTALLMRATCAAAPNARFVYLSAIGVGPARGEYLRVRWQLENELRESGLDFVIARPSFITGPDREERRRAERVWAALIDGLLALAPVLGLGRLRERYRSRTAPQLADALAHHAFRPESARAILEGAALFSLAGTRRAT